MTTGNRDYQIDAEGRGPSGLAGRWLGRNGLGLAARRLAVALRRGRLVAAVARVANEPEQLQGQLRLGGTAVRARRLLVWQFPVNHARYRPPVFSARRR